MSKSVEIDHYPEAAENGKAIRRLELLGVKEELREAPDRRKFFANVTDEQLGKLLGYVNSVSRGQPISYEYADGQLAALETPPLEEKDRLMDLTFQTVREIAEDTTLEDHEALRRAGLALSGAVNYIHPYENGNGRSGRILHYLVEYGTERGDDAFNEEMYAIIGKLPVYDSDANVALNDTPPSALERALEVQVAQRHSEDLSKRELATARVMVFLDMMRGKTQVPINERVFRAAPPAPVDIPAGTVDGLELYEREYQSLSAITGRLPDEVPPTAHRVMADKPTKEIPTVALKLDVL